MSQWIRATNDPLREAQIKRSRWAGKYPTHLPRGEEVGWLKEDIRAATEMMEEVKAAGGIPGHMAYIENFDYWKGPGEVLRNRLSQSMEMNSPALQELEKRGIRRYQVMGGLGNNLPTTPIYLTARDLQNVGRFGNKWASTYQGKGKDWGLKVLQDRFRRPVLDVFKHSVFGVTVPTQYGTSSDIVMCSSRYVDSSDILSALDMQVRTSVVVDPPPPDPNAPPKGPKGKGPVQPPRPPQVRPPRGWQPSDKQYDAPESDPPPPPVRKGGSSLVQLLDASGKPWGPVMHFSPHTGKVQPLEDERMIRKDGKDTSCELAKALNTTMPGDACGPPAPKIVCEVHVQVNSFLPRSGTRGEIDANKFEDRIASSILCHESLESSTSTTCAVFETVRPANSEPKETSRPPAIMTGCGPAYSNATTVNDQYCEPPECPTRSARYITPLPTVRHSAMEPKPSPTTPRPHYRSCDMVVATNIARSKGCKHTAAIKFGTLCRDMTMGGPETTTITFNNTMTDPKGKIAPTVIPMTQAGYVLPRATTFTDQYCEPPECPSRTPRWTTPLTLWTYWARPAKETEFPQWCDWDEHLGTSDFGPSPLGIATEA
ncbi:hypothetical protein Slin15195_G105400 [Septoria linicola]|uniref:Uncharacterized protein n=1 Tax=Septoria linicola TaxID=215465 RepID=A0A9Q9B6I5_9PEZI|nr:hypothetical protein Slin15195_G105400 [Septoria linicola]